MNIICVSGHAKFNIKRERQREREREREREEEEEEEDDEIIKESSQHEHTEQCGHM